MKFRSIQPKYFRVRVFMHLPGMHHQYLLSELGMEMGLGPLGQPCAENQRCAVSSTSAWNSATSDAPLSTSPSPSSPSSGRLNADEPDAPDASSLGRIPLLLLDGSESLGILLSAPSRGVGSNEPAGCVTVFTLVFVAPKHRLTCQLCLDLQPLTHVRPKFTCLKCHRRSRTVGTTPRRRKRWASLRDGCRVGRGRCRGAAPPRPGTLWLCREAPRAPPTSVLQTFPLSGREVGRSAPRRFDDQCGVGR